MLGFASTFRLNATVPGRPSEPERRGRPLHRARHHPGGAAAAGPAAAGDSAGGGLAVALLVALRDAGEALPAAAALMSPHVDLTSSGASMTERADQDPIFTPAALRQMASDYLAGADPTTPLAALLH